MNGAELKRLRLAMRLDELQVGRAIGYTGTDRNVINRIREFERDKKQVPLYIARLVWLMGRFFAKTGGLPKFPAWPGYEFESIPDQQGEA